MATYTKVLLSASSQGQPITVVQTASTGTTIHATGTSSTTIDEVWLYANNTSTSPVLLTVQFGGTGSVQHAKPITLATVRRCSYCGWLAIDRHRCGSNNDICLRCNCIGHYDFRLCKQDFLMANPNRRGQASASVRTGMTGSNVTPWTNTHFVLPYGLQLQQTKNAGDTSVTIPAGINFVYAIAVGGGGGGIIAGSGGAGGVAWGWTLATSSCVVGAGGTNAQGGYTRYGNVIAGGGGVGNQAGIIGGAGGGGSTGVAGAGSTNYWGIPGGAGLAGSVGTKGISGGGAGGGGGTSTNATAGAGGDGISGGGGGRCETTGSGTNTGGNGGNGLVGGGGGNATVSTGTRIGGTGGNGINILTGAQTTGGAGTTGTNTNGGGGGGAGIAGNGTAASGLNGGAGGLGGGGGGQGATASNQTGGAGILYLFY